MSSIANRVITQALLRDLSTLCRNGIVTNLDLKKTSRWKIGGVAALIIRSGTISEIIALRKYFYSNNVPHTVIVLITNLLFSDSGLNIPCIQINSKLAKVSTDHLSGIVQAEAEVWVPGFARRLQQEGLCQWKE